VGINTGDDAAVYRLQGNLCTVQTADFFPPIVDDPYDFGAIAVANALSDVYAMGGVPILGLNLVCFPDDLPMEILHQILRGGADKAREAGLLVAGGHTIKDKEPKYGMAVTGTVACDAILTNAGAKAGDRLVLTKPLGTGIITTAGMNDRTDAETMAGAVASMAALNRAASEAVLTVGANACTDVTGFGLIGHLLTMMNASGTSAHLQMSAIPLLPGVRELVEQGISPGGTGRNLESVGRQTHWHPDMSVEDQLLLCDAQTSGGLLVSVAQDKVDQLIHELTARNTLAEIIGTVSKQGDAPVEVAP
jgi:selenide,water dikinase